MKLGLFIYDGLSIVLMLLSGLFFILTGVLWYDSQVYIIEWCISSFTSVNVVMMVLLDWMSLTFLGSVCLISGCIMKYCEYYMEGEINYTRFIYLVVLFVGSMWALVISPNLISILLGWDGLGLTSYLLVIFYQNESANNAGMLTLLSNRIGDASILMSIGLMFSVGSWNFFILDSVDKLILGLVGLAAMTKSAQIPFSAWLPAAMAAPTPVSALVHSSTLVTAGVYLLIRFESLISGGVCSDVLMASSVLTMFMAGVVANFESDMKKIVAFSTLSQLGLMIMVLSAGLPDLAFYHLITHAMFKSVLFMCVGVFIHDLGGSQDLGYSGGVISSNPFLSVVFMVSNLSLCGMPFLSGFYSKDCVVESMLDKGGNFLLLVMLVLSIGLTVAYTLRLVYKVSLGENGLLSLSSVDSSSTNLVISMSCLYSMSLMAGFLYFWGFIQSGMYVSLVSYEKSLVIGISVFSGLFTYFLLSNSFNMKNSFFYSMWYMKFLSTKMMNKPMLMNCMLSSKIFDMGWLEYYGGWGGSLFMEKASEKVEMWQGGLMVKGNLLGLVLVVIFALMVLNV